MIENPFRRYDDAAELNGYAATAMIARALGNFDEANLYEEWAQHGFALVPRGMTYQEIPARSGSIDLSVALAAVERAGRRIPPNWPTLYTEYP